MAKLSDRTNKIQVVPSPQSPAVAGFIQQYSGTIAPSGWLECDGSAISRTDFAELFSAIGTKYGIGDGSTTFNLPDGPRRTSEIDTDASNSNGGSTTFKQGYVYQTAYGEWRFSFNFFFNGATSGSTPIITVPGIIFKENGIAQSVSVRCNQGIVGNGFVVGGDNTINITYDTALTYVNVSGDVALDAKPTDAFVGADSRFSTFDEALESIPIIKLYNDGGNVSVASVAASPTEQGTIQLSEAFAATPTTYGLVKSGGSSVFSKVALTSNIPNISSGVETKITANRIDHDPNSLWDDTNKRFIPNESGWYEIGGFVFMTSAGMRSANVYIRKNGLEEVSNQQDIVPFFSSSNPANNIGTVINAIMFFNGTTDFVEVFAECDTTSGTWSINGAVFTDGTFLSIKKIG